MKARIYYFSATGNSLVVALDLAKALGDVGVVPMTAMLADCSLQDYEAVGFVYPVYMFGLPLIVVDFLQTINIKPGTHVFSLATLGGLPGRAHSMVRDILAQRGITLAAGFSIRMPGNYTPLYEPVSKEKQDALFKKEKVRVGEIAEFIKERKIGVKEENPVLVNYLLYSVLYRGGSAQIPLAAKYFWITDACTKCGLCSKVCPVRNIEMNDGKPVWLTRCQHCMACLQWCPAQAIQFKDKTAGKRRYHHPDVTAQDIMAQQLTP